MTIKIPKYAQNAINKGITVEQYFCSNCSKQRWFNTSTDSYSCLKCSATEWIKVERTLTPLQKEKIRIESGGKCANPGCSVWRTHIHHIDEWAIFHSDDPNILIPVCPSCHDQIHHGNLSISRDTLINWKSIKRSKVIRNLHLYIEPGQKIKFLLGGLWIFNKIENWQFKLFNIAPEVNFNLNIQDGRLSFINLSISDINDQKSIAVFSNYIEIIDEDLLCEERNGHIKIYTKNINKYLPQSLVEIVRTREPNYALNELVLLELEVIGQGEVSMKGCWHSRGKAVIMTENGLTFAPSMSVLLSKDSDSGLTYSGDKPLFSFKQ